MRTSLLQTISFYILLSLNSCEPARDTPVISPITKIVLSDSLQPIVDSLALFAVVHDAAIGYAGIETTVYRHFKKLQAKATDKELISLTDHDTASVRAYAYWALAKRKNPEIKNILRRHMKDTTKFWYTSGCSPDPERVNQFYLDLVNPEYNTPDCIKLTTNEVEEFSKVIDK
ncbi:MAG: hypothetical protein V4580_19175 [Bacteroidota bacterium]